MSDEILSLLLMALAGALVVPIGLFARWLEIRAEDRDADHTSAK